MSLFPAQRRHLQKQSNAVRAAVKQLQADLGRPVTEEEIEAQTWLPPQNVVDRLKWLAGRGVVRREGDGWVLAEESGLSFTDGGCSAFFLISDTAPGQ